MSSTIYIIKRFFFLFEQKTSYEMRISHWGSDVCSSDLCVRQHAFAHPPIVHDKSAGDKCDAVLCRDPSKLFGHNYAVFMGESQDIVRGRLPIVGACIW